MKEQSNKAISVKELTIHEIISGAMRGKKSFAFWKKQDENSLQGIIDLGNGPLAGKIDLEETEPGFIVSPFLNESGAKSLKINANLVFKQGKEAGRYSIHPSVEVLSSATDQFLSDIERAGELPSDLYFPESPAAVLPDFKELIRRSVQHIRSGLFIKVVPSRFVDMPYPQGWHFITAFEQLQALYPTAFVYLVGIPGIGTWMGATPELLMSVENRRLFRSVALAGTQQMPSSGCISEVAWTQKEIEEQALVVRYIINCFKKIRLREFEEKGPKTVQAGNLVHLKTEFYVDMEAANFPQLGSVMLDLLHPTSAVCGMPLDATRAFLPANENYEREYFAGYVGPVNMHSCTQLYVNLRCMKLMAHTARLYAGAGVTEDSVADKEWEETELKLQTLGRLFW